MLICRWAKGGRRGSRGLAPSKMMIKLVHRPVLSLVRGPGRVRGVVQTPFPPGAAALCADKNMHHYLIPLLTLAREGRTQSQVKATHAGPRPPSPPSPLPPPPYQPQHATLTTHTPRDVSTNHTLQSHPPQPYSASARGCRPRRRPPPRPRPRPRSTSASSSSASTSAGSRAAPPSPSAAPPAAPPPRRPRSKARAGEGRGRRRRTGAAVALGSGLARGSCRG